MDPVIQISKMFCISEIMVDLVYLQQINSVLRSKAVSGTGKTAMKEKVRILE